MIFKPSVIEKYMISKSFFNVKIITPKVMTPKLKRFMSVSQLHNLVDMDLFRQNGQKKGISNPLKYE